MENLGDYITSLKNEIDQIETELVIGVPDNISLLNKIAQRKHKLELLQEVQGIFEQLRNSGKIASPAMADIPISTTYSPS